MFYPTPFPDPGTDNYEPPLPGIAWLFEFL